MRNRIYLSIITVALLCVAGWMVHAQMQGGNSARETWEYKSIPILRTNITEDWSMWYEDNKALPLPVDGTAKQEELGNQGWELVAVATIADVPGGATTRMQQFFKRRK